MHLSHAKGKSHQALIEGKRRKTTLRDRLHIKGQNANIFCENILGLFTFSFSIDLITPQITLL